DAAAGPAAAGGGGRRAGDDDPSGVPGHGAGGRGGVRRPEAGAELVEAAAVRGAGRGPGGRRADAGGGGGGGGGASGGAGAGEAGGWEAVLAWRGEEESAAAGWAGEGAALAFDESREGELLRRYQLGLARTFHRSVDTFYKARREAERRDESESAAADETN